MEAYGYLAGYLTILIVSILTVTRTRAAIAEFTSEDNRISWVKAGDKLEISWEYNLRDDSSKFEAVRLVQYIGKDGGQSKVIAVIKADKTVFYSDLAAFKDRVTWTGNLDQSKASFSIKDIQTAQTEYELACGLYIDATVKVYQPVNVSIGVPPSDVQFKGEYIDDGQTFTVQAGATYSKEFMLSYSYADSRPSPELVCNYGGKEIKNPNRLKISASSSYTCSVRNELGKGGEISFALGDGQDPNTGARTNDDGVIAGSVIAAVFVIGIIVVVVFIFVKKKRAASAPREPDQPKRSSSTVHPEDEPAPEQGELARVRPHNNK